MNETVGSHQDVLSGLKACLEQLQDEVASSGMTIAAILIGAAAEAVADEIHHAPLVLDESPRRLNA